MSPVQESNMQMLAAKYMAEHPTVYSRDDVFGLDSQGVVTTSDFATLWKKVCPSPIQIPDLSYHGSDEMNAVVESDGNMIAVDKRLANDTVNILVIQAIFASRSAVAQESAPHQISSNAIAFLSVRGFGVLAIEALDSVRHTRISASARLDWFTWLVVALAPYTFNRIIYLLALVSHRQSNQKLSWIPKLSKRAKRSFDLVDAHFRENPPILFDSGFDPDGNYSDQEISSMLIDREILQCGALSWLIMHDKQNEEWESAIVPFLRSNDEYLVADTVQALASVAVDQSIAIERIRECLNHNSVLVIGCAYQSLIRLNDDSDFLDRVENDLVRRGIPFE